VNLFPEERPEPKPKPLRLVVVVVGTYLVVCLCYIWLSDIIAAKVARDLVQLRTIETVKGFLFIVTTATGLFLALWFMLARIYAQQRELLRQRHALMESERRAVAGLFASSVAHDINNILMVLQFDMEDLAKATELTPAHKELVNRITPAIGDLAVLAKRLSQMGKHVVSDDFNELDLVEVARGVTGLLRAHKLVKDGTLALSGESSLLMEANATAIRQLIVNLVLNAAEATEGKGHIEVRVHHMDGTAAIEVHDDGPGFLPENRGTLMGPLISSKPDGTGLGLLSVKVYAEAHQGRVEISSSRLGGACVKVELPVRHITPSERQASGWQDLWAIR
jgi:signal transduction histidine kinase